MLSLSEIFPLHWIRLQESLAVLYSPAHPLVFKQFLRGDESRAAKPAKSGLDATNAVGRFPMQLKAIRSSPVDTARTSSFLEASYDAGGMSVFIFLLAKVQNYVPFQTLGPCIQKVMQASGQIIRPEIRR